MQDETPQMISSDVILQRWETMLEQSGRLLSRLEQQIHLQSNPVSGTCAVFFDDEVFDIALPYAAFDAYQFKIASRHSAPDPLLFTQLLDLIPTMTDKSIIDVGSFTGLSGLILRRFLLPKNLIMIEPQRVCQSHLARTIAANPEGCDVTLLPHVIDEEGSTIARGLTRADRLSETVYLRRGEGMLNATSIDSIAPKDVGLINIDIPGQKIYALRGAALTLETYRPVVIVNLTGRDAPEIQEYMKTQDYEFARAGSHSAFLLPK